ncbi:insecticidal delta-endotoxin Cry8Ea1 family protein, partial [Bacillus cereus]
MNYKDWGDRCADGELFARSNAVIDGVVAGTAITSYILSLAFPIASAATGIMSVLLPILWPPTAGNPGTSDAQFTWKQMMLAVEELINNAITAEAKRDAIDALENLQTSVNAYNQAVCNFQNNPGNDIYKLPVQRAFENADRQASQAINHLNDNPPTHAVQFLPSYAQAANIHLLLLRDVVQYGESWGFTSTQVQQYYDNPPPRPGNPGMKQRLSQYTDYCVRWYNTGLQQQYNTGNWNKFNDFRRDMTIMVLDIVSLWPTYDPKIYAVPTKSELTRTVYTPLIGYSGSRDSPNVPINIAEGSLVDIPRLFKWLRELQVDARETINALNITGRKLIFQNTLNNELWEGGYRGNPGITTETLTIPSPQSNDDVWKITTNASNPYIQGVLYIKGWDFSFTQSSDQSIYPRTYQTEKIRSGLPCRGYFPAPCAPCDPNNLCSVEIPNRSVPCDEKNLYSHRFSYFGAGHSADAQALSYFSYGWTHVSADANNLIDPYKITQIPAVKGSSIWNGATVIKGPGSTGGDLVQLPIRTSMHLEVTIPGFDEDIVSYYSIRIRYASSQATSLGVQFEGEIEEGSRLVELPATYSGGDLTYNTFGYQFATEVTSHSDSQRGTIILNHVGPSGPNIIIDKIEFVPQKGSVEEY